MRASSKYRRSINEALVSTHPGEPEISLPNFIYELKDFPSIFKWRVNRVRNEWKHRGVPSKKVPDWWKWRELRRQPSDASRTWLEYQFAIAPLISDLHNMFQVATWMESRARMLKNIREKGFISRKARLGNLEYEEAQDNYPFASQGGAVWGNSQVECTASAWVSARYRHTGHLPLGSFLQSEHHSLFLAALGLNVSFETFWDAMPWSWLIDYFTDLSSILTIHDNRAGFAFDGGCYMETVTCKRTIHPRPNFIWQGPVVTGYKRKTRTPVTASIFDVGINVLNQRQLANLGALFVSRIR